MTPNALINPVLPGFHPDPSILRVGSDFYLATSTFEWWPGVRIHHSRDLRHWRHLGYACTRTSQLDLRGNPDSAGIWAPCLSYHDGVFYMVYTNVRSTIGAHKDTHNYIVTARLPEGPWSEPVHVNSSGFDPSLFHDDDGRSWFLNMQWDHRPGHDPFCGILLQEWDRETQRLKGPVHRIFTGTSLGVVEGPHLYKRDGWYVLLTAEGGTFYEHAVTIARSRRIEGPYELSPHHPLLTAWESDPAGLQRAGHGSLVDAGNGEWYLAHLCGRPVEWRQAPPAAPPSRYENLHCPLGRETALQRVTWTEDGWPRLAHGSNAPASELAAPALPPAPFEAEPERDDFNGPTLSGHWNALRVPFSEDWVSLGARPGHLRLIGRESLMSLFDQSLVARRQQHFRCEAETLVDFEPTSFQQTAGLVAYYNTQNHAYLHVTHDERNGGRVLRLMVNDRGIPSEPALPVPIGERGPVRLRVRFDGALFSFEYALDAGPWRHIGHALQTAMLSDEHATRFEGSVARSFGFTGNFIGLACQDLGGQRLHADFDHFSYRPLPD
ncbi:glycoside hydrolase family 43 protein [Rhizobacter sp. LjRoot28]|uniref:glycoside hydrolase family 43 protein n=1 Tax=Rhizobacter sp. LjRoot28 TaxID=3342309 RepID=UPI003ECE7571